MTARLFLRVWTASALKLMSYRVDFWISTTGSFAAELAVAYFLWHAVFAAPNVTSVGGFGERAMICYYVVALLVGRVVAGQERDATISEDIYQGSLTRYLLYPASYFGLKFAEHLGNAVPALIQLALVAALGAAAFDVPGELAVTPASVAMGLAAMALAAYLHFVLVFPILCVAFWADNVWALIVMYRFAATMLGGLYLPLSLFPAWTQSLLAALPFEYLFSFPVMTLLGRVGPREWLAGMGVSLVWCAIGYAIARAVFRRGTLGYTGVGI